MRLKRLISAFIACAMLVTFMPMQAFAAPKDLNDTEFHINGISQMKELVSDKTGISIDRITIHGVEVNGTRQGEPATATGGVVDHGYLNAGDVGTLGNSALAGYPNYWNVLNTFDIIDAETVSSITVYARKDYKNLFNKGDRLDGVTVYLNPEDVHIIVNELEHKLITEIGLAQATLKPQYTLTYDVNGGTGEIASQTYSEGTEVSVISVEEAKKVISRDEATLLGFSETPTEKSPITTATEAENVSLVTSVTMNQPIILYAVWAEDKNKNGKPDYSETKYTVTYKDGADGAVFKDFVTSNLLEGDPTPLAPEVPEREGYDFGGWTPEPEAIVEGAKHDIIYTAQWKPKPVAEKVTFIYNAGENGKLEDGAEPTKVYDVNDTGKYPLEAPAVIANPGYVFVNWQLPAGLTFDASTGNVLVTGAVAGQTYTITAQYQKDESSIKELSYKVEYYVDGTLKAVKEFKENIWAGTDTLTVTEDNLDNSFGILHTTTPALPADVKNGDAIQAYYYSDSNKDGIADMNQIHIIFKVDAEKGNMTGNEDFWWTWDENKPVEVALNAPVITAKDGYTFTGWACEEATVTEEDGVYYLTDYTVGRTYILKAQFEEVVTEQVRPVFVYKYDGKQVGEMFSGLIMSKGVHNFSEIIDQLKNYAPEGYKVVSLGDFYADQDVEVTVEVEPTNPDAGKTLRIHWAIDNPEAASWKLYEGNARTETIAWADRNNFLVMPEVDVKEGYKLNGWSVSGTEGQMWGADIVTFRLGDELIVKDDDNTGGDISITANIVSNESSDVIMNIRFVDEDTGEFVAGGDYFLPAGVQNYSILEEYVPDGYEMTVSGDFTVTADGKLEVPVKKIAVEPDEVIINIRFMDGDEFVAGGDYPFEKDESVQFGDLELPEGYELDTEKNSAEDGFMARDGAQIIVHVKKAETDVIMNIRFVDEDTGEFVAGGDYFLPAGVQNYSILEEYVPDGYEMTVSGDFTVTADGKLEVPVKKIAVEPGDVTMNIRFMDEDTGEFVAGGDYFLPAGVQNYSILEEYVPDGYEMTVSGDFTVTADGKLEVPVKKIAVEPGDVTMNIRFMDGDEFIAGGNYLIPEGVQSYSILEKYVPEGYRMAVSGDFMAVDGGELEVPLEKEEAVKYTVTVKGSYANNSGEGKYAPGEPVTVRAGSREDYSFDDWESDDVDFEDADSRTTTFIMPAGDVTVTATWDRDSGGGAQHPDAGDNDDDDDNDRDDDTEEIIDEEVPLAETPWLNTEDHYAYVVGYSEDSTVRPNANITRAEVATIFFRLLTDNARDQFWMTSNNFSDVLPNDWYNTAVSTMVNMGIIQGYEDGTFRPNANITRAEFATIAARFLASGYEVEDDLFGDIAAHWARESINDAAMAGWINGYEDGTFRPDAAITRAEAVTMANNVLGRKPDADHMLDSMIKWTDNMDTSAWYYEAIQEATNSHDYDLFEDAEYETWTALQENRDWSALEKDWANAHVA